MASDVNAPSTCAALSVDLLSAPPTYTSTPCTHVRLTGRTPASLLRSTIPARHLVELSDMLASAAHARHERSIVRYSHRDVRWNQQVFSAPSADHPVPLHVH